MSFCQAQMDDFEKILNQSQMFLYKPCVRQIFQAFTKAPQLEQPFTHLDLTDVSLLPYLLQVFSLNYTEVEALFMHFAI